MHDIMPLRSELDFAPFSDLDAFSAIGAEPLLSDDIWKKFEFDFPEISNLDDVFTELDSFYHLNDSLLTDFSQPLMSQDLELQIRNHDCMWAGHCASKEHPVDEPSGHKIACSSSIKSEAPGVSYRAPAAAATTAASLAAAGSTAVITSIHKKPIKTPNQQSLLKPTLRAAGLPIINLMSPQTPPMSDDEEVKCKTSKALSQFLQNSGITDFDPDDKDLCEYFKDEEELDEQSEEEEEEIVEEEDEEEEEEIDDKKVLQSVIQQQEMSQTLRAYKYAAESDHSYHKDKNASMRVQNLGIDTPSDSEEEIDVVSVGDKFNTVSRLTCALPTNPSRSDRRQLQRTMASAISNRHTIKTIMPAARKSSDYSPVKRKDARGTKRKAYRVNPAPVATSPYKRRSYQNSSDSEPEPSEKRSLHNNMERQRRIDLRNAFEYLRQLVPEVVKKDRAAKVVILREAARYCTNLTNASSNLNRQVDEMKRHQERLRMRVSMLRRNLAAKR